MAESSKDNPEVQPKPERRRFSIEYKRRIVVEAEQCQHGELGSLLRREGLTYAQIGKWRTAYAEGTLGKKRRISLTKSAKNAFVVPNLLEQDFSTSGINMAIQHQRPSAGMKKTHRISGNIYPNIFKGKIDDGNNTINSSTVT